MKKNLLNSYVFDHIKSIEQNISDFRKYKNPECLHCLRVDIKKISAVISFAEKVFKEKYSSAKLNQLFHDAGKIREVQININLLSSFPKPPKRLITLLKMKENILIEEFILKESFFRKCIKKFRKRIFFPKKLVDKKTIKKYFDVEKGKINKTIQNKDREGMHRYRIRLKKMMYIYNLLPEKLQKNIELNDVMMEKQQLELGDWHDNYSAVNFISREQVPKSSIKYIIKLKNKEKMQFEALFKPLTHKL